MSSAGAEQDLLHNIESGIASRRILEFAARGFVPLPPGELVRAIASILATGDGDLKSLAEETFKGFGSSALREAVLSPGVRGEQLDVIARRSNENDVLEPLIRHKAVFDDTLAWLAERIGPWLQDVLVTNQVRLLAAPIIVERLFENPQLSSEIRRRADEFLEEFFLKKEREQEAEERAAAEAAEAAAEAAKAAALKPAVTAPAAAAEKEEVPAPEAAAEEDEESLVSRLSTLTVAQRILIAYRGNKEERLFLVRDNNRLVAMAVLKSPKTREADVETIASMKSVSDDVLRAIGLRKDFMRRYSILSTLVKNPRAPIDVTVGLVPRLNARDVRQLARDRNVPEAVRANARRIAARFEV